MKRFNDFINERLIINKDKSNINDFRITAIKKHPKNCSWKFLVIETYVSTLESLFGKPAYDCSKDSHFNFGVDKTSIQYFLNVSCEVENKMVDYGITIYDYDAHEYDDENDLPIYNKDEIFTFHIGTPGNSNETRDLILKTFNEFIEENGLSKEMKVYIQKMPWMP